MASATKPDDHARRAASSCASRPEPADSASCSSRSQVSASTGSRNLAPAAGTGSHWAAEVGQYRSNIGAASLIVAGMPGITGNPDLA
jgi:hypothetical protein